MADEYLFGVIPMTSLQHTIAHITIIAVVVCTIIILVAISAVWLESIFCTPGELTRAVSGSYFNAIQKHYKVISYEQGSKHIIVTYVKTC